MSEKATKRKTLEDRAQMTDLERLRHSCAHVLATALLKIWPQAQLAAGPPVDNGFYYDLELDHSITPEDFEKIEAEMKKVIKANQPFEKEMISRQEAVELGKSGRLAALSERPHASTFKLDLLQDIPEEEAISLYKNGDFIDLCAGPHVSHTSKCKAFKIMSVASAYYKGDAKNPQLQRVYGTAFPNRQELEDYLNQLEEAKKRDHRKIGKELQLFTFDPEDIGTGLPLWLPKGAIIIEELEKLAKESEFQLGYERVKTPHIAKENLYLTSGHIPFFKEDMYPAISVVDEEADTTKTKYYLKAMNCPHHHKIFAAIPRSYRDLPLRLAEYGTCYRYEKSGQLFGTMRARTMQMNDAHIYCSKEQLKEEFQKVHQLYEKYFEIFGIEKYLMRFSTHDPTKLGEKYENDPEKWEEIETLVRSILENSTVNFVEVSGEAAFYGPKIDVQIWSAIGREFTLSTNQVDFAQPRRFDLTYKTASNKDEHPLCIHRAPLGTHERFIGFLIEHFAGAFPTWLSPEQVRILPISDKFNEYAQKIYRQLKEAHIRVHVDTQSDKIGAKIRLAQIEKVPYMLVVGKQEEEAKTISIRHRQRGDVGSSTIEEFKEKLLQEIHSRALH